MCWNWQEVCGYCSSPCFEDNNTITGIVITVRDITERMQVEEEGAVILGELRDALSNIKTLQGLRPGCSSRNMIRDDKGYWRRIENHVRDHSEADFSHRYCPDCLKRFYPDVADIKDKTGFELYRKRETDFKILEA